MVVKLEPGQVLLTEEFIRLILELEVAPDMKILQVVPHSHGLIERRIGIKG